MSEVPAKPTTQNHIASVAPNDNPIRSVLQVPILSGCYNDWKVEGEAAKTAA